MTQTLTLPSQFTGIHLRPPSIAVASTNMRPPITAAFRNLAKVYHPDVGYERNGGGGDGEFIEIRNAYVTLSDPVAREVYDMKARRRAAVAGERRGFYGCRRWETDQCW
nr:chaperone protein DnaJ 11, chloroplastic [Tanacetum cinerariifolium]